MQNIKPRKRIYLRRIYLIIDIDSQLLLKK